MMTLGKAIYERRKELGMTQKELASKVLKEDGKPISIPYVNDIEHDRRTPTSDHLIKQFADALKISELKLNFYLGQFPDELSVRYGNIRDERVINAAYEAFTRVLKKSQKKSQVKARAA